MRLLILFPCLLFLTGCGSWNRPSEGTAVPQTIEPLDERPYVTGWVDGSQVKLAVDTGASQPSVLFSECITQLGGKIRGKGELKSTNLEVFVYQNQPNDEEPLAAAEVPHPGFEGLVGWPLVRRFVWHLDYPKGEHEFSTEVPFWVRNSYTSMTLSTRDELPHIENPAGLKIVLDTGAPYGIYLSKSRWAQWKAANPYALITLYDGFSPAAGGSYARECARVNSFTLNGVEFKNIIIAESFIDKKVMKLDRNIDIIIGLDALKSRDIWIDGIHNKMYFGADKGRPPGDKIPLNLAGIVFLPRSEGKLTYEAVVLKDSVAWKSGLRSGDKLISLNNRKYPDSELINYLTKTPGVHAGAQIWRHGKIKYFRWFVPTEAQLTPKPPPPLENFLNDSQLPPIIDGQPLAPIESSPAPSPVQDNSSSISLPLNSSPNFHGSL